MVLDANSAVFTTVEQQVNFHGRLRPDTLHLKLYSQEMPRGGLTLIILSQSH